MASNLALDLNGGDDEDAAIRRAIAMSLGRDVDEDTALQPDETTEKAIIEPGQFDVSPKATASEGDVASYRQAPLDAAAGQQSSSNIFSTFGLDRKKMEEERLARLKRKAEGPPELRNTSSTQALDAAVLPSSKRSRQEPAPASTKLPTLKTSGHLSIVPATMSTSSKLQFPQGVVKKTWAFGQQRQDDIKIEEVLRKNDLELAVLSSFQWDDEWLMSKLDLTKTKIILIAFAANEAQKAEMRSNVPSDTIRFCFPAMGGGPGCMHSKLQLLKFPDYLRVVIPTGNLVPYDWGETGVMENMVFLIDLPRIQDIDIRQTNQLTAFGEDLSFFLTAQGMEEKLVKSLRNYDFSATSRYGFIHTIAGSHVEDWQRTGYCGLGRSVDALGLRTEQPIDIDMVCSSIGSVKYDLLSSLYNACQGDQELRESKARTSSSKKGGPSTDQSVVLKERIRVYFPSQQTVASSRGGKEAAGTICFQSRWWDSPSFPREVLRDCRNIRQGLLLHTKAMFVRRHGLQADHSPGWAYVGSANLSESAWGRLVKDRASGKAKLNCRNWECGVLIPISLSEGDDTAVTVKSRRTDEAPSLHDIFRERVPIPMEVPGTPYTSDDTRRPWFYMED